MSILTVSRGDQPTWESEHNIKAKDRIRKKLQRDVDQFIADGNAITKLAGSERAFEKLEHAMMRKMPTGQGLGL